MLSQRRQARRIHTSALFQYGLKKKVKETEPDPSEDPDMAGRLGRKRKTPAELAAEAEAGEEEDESKFSSLCCCFSFL